MCTRFLDQKDDGSQFYILSIKASQIHKLDDLRVIITIGLNVNWIERYWCKYNFLP